MARKGDNPPKTPAAKPKDTVSEVLDEGDSPDTEYDTDDMADLPTDSEEEGGQDDLSGLDPDSEGDPQ